MTVRNAIGPDYYVNVQDVILTNIDFTDEFEKSVEDKVVAEQDKQAAITRAEAQLEVAKLEDGKQQEVVCPNCGEHYVYPILDENNQPGISNLMSIMSKITGESFESIENRYDGVGYGAFKKEVANVVAELLTDIQSKYKKFSDHNYLNDILLSGAKKAKIVAEETLERTKKSLGLC